MPSPANRGNVLRTLSLFLHASHRDAGDDEPGHERVKDQNGYQGDGDPQINSSVFGTINVAPEHLHQHGEGVFPGTGDEHEGTEEIVPGCDEGEYRLGGNGRGNYRQNDDVEYPEFPGSVNAGGIDKIDGKHRGHVLPEKKHRGGPRDGRDDQGDVVIQQMKPGHELVKPDEGKGPRKHHDEEDEAPQKTPAPETVYMKAVGGHGSKIDRQHRGADGKEGAVVKTLPDLKTPARQGIPVVKGVF